MVDFSHYKSTASLTLRLKTIQRMYANNIYVLAMKGTDNS